MLALAAARRRRLTRVMENETDFVDSRDRTEILCQLVLILTGTIRAP